MVDFLRIPFLYILKVPLFEKLLSVYCHCSTGPVITVKVVVVVVEGPAVVDVVVEVEPLGAVVVVVKNGSSVVVISGPAVVDVVVVCSDLPVSRPLSSTSGSVPE